MWYLTDFFCATVELIGVGPGEESSTGTGSSTDGASESTSSNGTLAYVPRFACGFP